MPNLDCAMYLSNQRLPHLLNDVVFSSNAHGFRDCTASIRLPRRVAYWYLQQQGRLSVKVAYLGRVLWEGDVRSLDLTGDGLRIGALGPWAGLDDAPVTAWWSSTQTSRWQVAVDTLAPGSTVIGQAIPDRFELDTNNRLYIAPRKNENFGTPSFKGGNSVGAVYVQSPSLGATPFLYVSFAWTIVVASGTWRADLLAVNSVFAASTTQWTNLGAGTGTYAGIVAAANPLTLVFRFYAGGATFTYLGETGDTYLRITNLRVLGVNTAAITGATIITQLVSSAAALNGRISSDSVLIDTALNLDLFDEIWEDAQPSEVIDHLCLLGDTAGNRYEALFQQGRRLTVRQQGTENRVWVVFAEDLALRQDLDQIWNRRYAIYADPNNRTLRTSSANDTLSQQRLGIIRSTPIRADTTSAATATVIRDTALLDSANTGVETSFGITRLFAPEGGVVPLWMAQAGDIIVVANTPPDLQAVFGGAITFRLIETSYDVEANAATITPEAPPALLEQLLARRDSGR